MPVRRRRLTARDSGTDGCETEPVLKERLHFERLLADLSARFAEVQGDEVVLAIENSLRALLDFFNYDRATYADLGRDNALSVLCSVAVDGVMPIERGRRFPEFTWLLGEIRSGRIVALPSLPQCLPPTALGEAEFCRRAGVRSHLSIPLRVDGRVTGVVSFAGLKRARTWPEEIITRLTIIGGVFASALARVRSNEELQRLRSRLWHADRVARIGALAAAIAHELNQPLTAILSNAQAGLNDLNSNRATSEEMRKVLEAVVHDDKRAAETIRSMRAMLRGGKTERERIDVADAVREVLQILDAELGRGGIRTELDFAAGLWLTADKVQIEQVILNLLLNAAAAMRTTPREDRLLGITARRAPGNTSLVVSIRDTGKGIAPDQLDAVFEPFYTTGGEGLGLGLSISRSIIEAHGGEIRVEPNPDRGVTFQFVLPAAASEADAHPAPAEPVGSVRPTAGSAQPVVCFVDDDASVRQSLVRLFSGRGWSTASYASVQPLLDGQPLANVGCLVLDVRIPEMSGLEFYARLCREGNAPPAVFLSGHADLATGIEAMKLGAVEFLEKPVDDEVLIAAVGKALKRHRREREQAQERKLAQARVVRLSAREREIAAQVIRGRLNKQIAADLRISEQTVKQHRGRVMEKMEASSIAELVRCCEASGLFTADAKAGPATTRSAASARHTSPVYTIPAK